MGELFFIRLLGCETSGRMMQVTGLEEQLEILLETAAKLAGGERGSISLYNPRIHCLKTRISLGLTSDALASVAYVDVGGGACGLAFRRVRTYAYTGTTSSGMLGWKWQSVHDPEVLPAVMERWQSSISSGEAFKMTFPLRGADAFSDRSTL